MTSRRASGLVAAALVSALGSQTAMAETRPQRIASIHLCADQLLLALVNRDRIASVTRLAADPQQSNMADAARGIPLNRGQAEEIVAFRPDLVLAGILSARPTVVLLQRLGYRVLDLAPVTSFAELRAQIRDLASVLDERGRGEALIAGLDGDLAAATPIGGESRRPVAALYQPNGFTMGSGTLEDAVFTVAGLDNLAPRIGITGVGHIPLERLILSRPDVLVFGAEGGRRPSAAIELLSHPAMHGLAAVSIDVPSRLWVCGGWFTAEAVARLSALGHAARGAP